MKNCKLQVTGYVWCQNQACLPAPGLMNTHLHDIAAFLTDRSEAVHFLTVRLCTKALSQKLRADVLSCTYVLSSNLYIILILLLHRSQKSCSTSQKNYPAVLMSASSKWMLFGR